MLWELYAAEVETRPGEMMSLDGHASTMNFHHQVATLSPPMRSG